MSLFLKDTLATERFAVLSLSLLALALLIVLLDKVDASPLNLLGRDNTV